MYKLKYEQAESRLKPVDNKTTIADPVRSINMASNEISSHECIGSLNPDQSGQVTVSITTATGPEVAEPKVRISPYQCRCTESKDNPAIVCRPHFLSSYLPEVHH